MSDSKLGKNYAKAEALYDAGDFGPLPKTTYDDALLSCLETYAIAPKVTKLSLSGCAQLSDEAISEVLNRCPNLQSLNLSGTATTAPFTTRQQGVAAVRRYYAQLALGSVTCTKLKVVIMGKGTAGKTSLVRALQALESGGGERPELPELDDRTIGVEMTLLFDTFAVHDFGGQPEYYPWHKLFLSREALYLLVADLSEGIDECVAALEEQLSILSASVPGAVVLVVLTKTDLVAQEKVGAGVVEVERRLFEWRDSRRLRRNEDRRGGFEEVDQEEGVAAAPSSTPRIQFPILCASSVTQEGIRETRDRMMEAATGAAGKGESASGDGSGASLEASAAAAEASSLSSSSSSSLSSNSGGGVKLFPKFNSQIPMTYEKVRVLFDAIMTGERDLAKAVDSNLLLEADAKKARTTVHFLRFKELLKIWNAVLAKLPVLRKKFDDSKSDPEQVLRDALDMLEGEGTALHSKLSGLVHLNPTWLASCVRPLADHRLHTIERRRAIAESWVARCSKRVEHSGWLEKKSDHLKQWRRRFFAFSFAPMPFLIYFKDEKDKAKERGRLALTGASVGLGKAPTELIVADEPRKTSFVLRATTQEERDQWIDWITGVEFSAELFSGTHHDAVKLLEDYAERGIASPSLLRELLQEDVLNRFDVDFEVVLRLLKEHKLLFPIVVSSTIRNSLTGDRSGGGGGAAAEEATSGWVVPVKLPSSPPDGFEAACALEEGDSAWEVIGHFGIFYLPPGLVQMTIAALHQLGQYVEYYQQGGFVQTDDLTMKYVCYFDLVDFRLVLRVQGTADRMRMKRQLEVMMREVDQVASNFSGLELEFDYKPREVRDRDAENARVAEDLREQRELRQRTLQVGAAQQQLELHKERQEHIELLKGRLLRLKREDELEYGKVWDSMDTEHLLASSAALARAHAGSSSVQQSTSFENADDLLTEAAEAQPIMLESMRKAIAAFPGSHFDAGPLKRRERIVEKVEKEYGGDYARVVDVVRASAVFQNAADLARLVGSLSNDGATEVKVVRVKDRFSNPVSGGYRDMLLNVRVGDLKHVGELQLHIESIKAIKPKAHRLYDLLRSYGWEGESLS